ncbi:retention module-containing protein [Aeromonas allosaccharophila]|uniref:Retention module-containing protein n=1 Tax=Aeromonas allosaccharophila TaxID=656 RepID=A0AAX3NW24_9GAMM|nr:retention module-containing protein [Aeromonas allosaccharophila]WED77626.1 retention module-containing protein [Aeromonas allosaccharophila]
MITNAVTLEQGVTVTQLKGQIYLVAADGSRKLLAEGDVLPKGAVIMSPDGASFMGGGQSFNVQPASEQSEPAEEGDAPQLAQNGAAGTPDDINALQQAILGGADPTQAFEASAAGGAPAAGGGGIGGVAGSSGNGGFVTIDRTGDATIAEATFDTTYNTNGEPPLGAAGEDEPLFISANLVLSADTQVNEGGLITFTATLDEPVFGSDLVIQLSNGAVITIPVGQSSGSVTVAAPADSPYVDPSTITVSITGTQGSGFNQIITGPSTTTQINDTVDTTTVTLGAPAQVNEGGQITYSASVNNAPQSDLVLTLSNGASITIKAGELSGNVTVDAPSDDVYKDGSSLTVSITGSQGGNYEQLDTSSTVTTAVVDTIDEVSVTIESNGDVTEVQQPVFTIKVSQVLDSALTVTLSNGDRVVIPKGETSVTYSPVAQGDDVFKDGGSLTVGIDSATVVGKSFENLELGGDATVTISDTVSEVVATLTADKSSVAEGGSVTYTVTLSNAANLPLTPHGELTFTLDNGKTITIAAGQTSGSVTVTAGDDVYTGGQADLSAKLTGVSGGDSFEKLTLGKETVTTKVTDEPNGEGDKVSVTIESNGDVTEVQQPVFTIKVSQVLDSALTVTLSNGDRVVIPKGETSVTYSPVAQGDDVFKDGGSLTVGIDSATVVGKSFENLELGGDATVTISDTVSEVVATLTADKSSVAEGGSVTYTVTLSNAANLPLTPHGELTFTLDNGKTITIAAGQTSGSVTVTAGDDVYTGGQADLSAKLTGVSGGDSFEKLTLGKETVTTKVTDEPNGEGDKVSVTIESNGDVTEVQQPVFTIKVSQVLDSALTVTLSNGDRVVIPKGETSVTYSPVAQGDDVFKDGGSLTVGIDSATVVGKSFENLELGGDATVTISDTVSEVVATLTADKSSVAEGGSVTYTVTLSNAANLPLTPHGELTFTLDNGKTITIAAGQTSGSVTVTAGDDVYTGGQADLSAKLTGVSGGDSFEKLTLGKETVTTKVTDEPNGEGDKVSVTIESNGDVTEVQQPVFTIKVSQVLDSALTVTLSNGDRVVIPKGETSVTYSPVAQGDDVFKDGGSLTVGIDSATVVGKSFENLELGGDATVTISDTVSEVVATLTADKSSVAEGGSVTYTVTLSNAANLPLTPHGELTFTLDNGKTITIAAGQTSGSVTVTAGDDVYTGGQADLSAKLTGVSGGDSFEKLTLGKETVTTKVTDEPNGEGDKVSVTIESNGDVTEVQQPVFTIKVSQVLDSALTVTLSNGDRVVIPKGETSVTYSPVAQGDDVFKDGGSLTVGIDSATVVGKSFENLELGGDATVTISDTVSEVVATLTADKSSVAEGGSVTYTVTLSNAANLPLTPHGELTFTLDNGKTITIAAGQTSGSVTVTAGDDVYTGGQADLSAKLTGVSGGDSFEKLTLGKETVTTKVTDEPNGEGDKVSVTIESNGDVTEVQQPVFTIKVSQVLDSALTVTLSNGDRVVIPKGETSVTYSPVAQGDDVFKDGGSLTVGIDSATVVGKSFENLELGGDATVTISDTVSEVVATLTADKSSVAEGGSVTYTVTLSNAANLPLTPHGELTFTLDNGKTITIAAGQTSGSVTVTAGDDVYTGGQADLSAKLTGVSGGDSFEKLTLGKETVTTKVTDEPNGEGDKVSVTIESNGDVTEVQQPVFTIKVSQVLDSALTVTLSNGDRVVIPKGETSVTYSPVAQGDDVFKDGGSLTVGIDSATVVGKSFENLELGGDATVTISDTVSEVVATLTADKSSVAEGGSVTYTVTLSNAANLPLTPHGELTFTLDNGKTITIAAGQTSGSVTVTAGDDVYTGGQADLSAKLTGVSGGDSFEKLTLGKETVTTKVTDEPNGEGDKVSVTIESNGDVTEVQQPVFTIKVSQVLDSALTVTLSNGDRVVIPKGETSVTYSPVAQGDDVFKDGGSLTVGIDSATVVGKSFENLELGGDATVTISDTVSEVVATLTADKSSVAEGGSVTYTVTLSNAANLPLTPHGELTFTLDNGKTITIAAGQTSGSVTVTAGDDVYTGGQADLSAKLTGVSGGDSFEKLTLGKETVTTKVTDEPNGEGDKVSVTIESNGDVTEVQQPVFTIKVSQVLDSALTVTLSNGDRVVIPKGETSVTYSPVAQGDDVFKDGGSLTVGIDSATVVGKSFENLELGGDATVTISDTVSEVVATLTADKSSVAEGGSVTYTVTLSNAANLPLTPHGELTFTLDNGKTITIAAGQTSGSVTVTAGDDVYTGGQADLSAKLTGVSGGDSFEKLTLGKETVTTKVTDEPNGEGDKVSVTIESNGDVTEVQQPVFTIKVSQVLDSALTVTLSNGDRVVIPKGETSVTYSPVAQGDDVFKDGGSLTVGIDSATVVGKSFENLELGGDATVTISDTVSEVVATLTADKSSVAEGGSVTYTVTLSNAANLPLTPHGELTFTLDNGKTITIAAGQTSGSVTVTAGDDVYTGGQADLSAKLTGVSGGDSFEKLTLGKETVTTKVTDEPNGEGDKVSVTIESNGDVTEVQQPVFTIKVSQVLDSALTVTLSNGDRVVIPKGETSVTYSPVAQGDDVFKDGGSLTVGIDSATVVGKSFENLELGGDATVTISDTVSEVVATLTADKSSVAEGGSVTYTVTLSNAANLPLTPHGELTFTLDNGKTITIAAGQTSGSVTVTAGDDVYTGGQADLSAKLTGVSGGDSFEKLTLGKETVTTKVTDEPNGEGDKVSVTIESNGDVTEVQQPVFTIKVSQVLDSALTVTLSNGDRVVIPKGETSVTYSPVAQGDDVFKDGGSLTVGIDSATVVGKSFENLELGGDATVTISDTVSEVVATLTADKSSVAEGGSVTYTVTLSNAANLPLTPHGELTFTLDNGKTITIAAGQTSGSVTVTAGDDVYTGGQADLSAKLTGVSGGDSFEKLTLGKETVTTKVTDEPNGEGDKATVLLSGPASVVEGSVTAEYTVTLSHAAKPGYKVLLSYSYTTASGDDIVETKEAVIGVDGKTAKFTIASVNDVRIEGSENFAVSVSKVLNAAGQDVFEGLDTAAAKVTTTIVDNDSVVALQDVVEGTAGNVLNVAPGVAFTGTTTLGGTVSLVNGKYVYQAPVRDHDDLVADTDSFTYTKADGSTVTYTINILDTNPIAANDSGSVAVGLNVQTIGSASLLANDIVVDSSSASPAKVYSVTGLNGQAMVLGASGSVTVAGKYGDLTVSADGSYTYTSKLDTDVQAVEGGAAVKSAFAVYGFQNNSLPLNGTSLNLNGLTDSATALVDVRTSGNNAKPGIGVSQGGGGTNDIGSGESLVIGLKALSNFAQIGINELNSGQGSASWKAYDANGVLVGSGTLVSSSSNGSLQSFNISTNTPFQYLVLGYSGNQNGYVIDSIKYTPAIGAVTEEFTYTVKDNDGDVSNSAVLTLNGNVPTTVAPTMLMGVEDSDVALTWTSFGISDNASTVRISGNQDGTGTIRYLDASTNQYKELGKNETQTFTKADIDSGKVKFDPEDNVSGADVYGNDKGVGNKGHDLTSIKFDVLRGNQVIASGKSVVVDLMPQADAPMLKVGTFSSLAAMDFENVGVGSGGWKDNINPNSINGAGAIGQWHANGSGLIEVGKESVYLGNEATSTTNQVMEIESSWNVSQLYTDIQCESGRFYQLNFDISARTTDGKKIETCGLKVYLIQIVNGQPVSGERIELYDFSPKSVGWLKGQSVGLNVPETGTYRLVFESKDASGNGDSYGAVLDNVKFQAVDNKGYEDSFIKLGKIDAELVDKDGSERLSVEIDGLPVGAVLKDAANHSVIVDATRKVDVTGWSLSTLQLKVNDPGNYNLLVKATATEVTSTGTVLDRAVSKVILPVEVLAANAAPVITATSVAVSEEGLSGGLIDATDFRAQDTNLDSTNDTSVSGQLAISDANGDTIQSVKLVAPTERITSGGTDIKWTVSADGMTLTGKMGSNGTTAVTVTIDKQGNYNVTLFKPLDHVNADNVEGRLAINVGVEASDGKATGTGTLTIQVEDDKPVVTDGSAVLKMTVQPTNLMLVLDVSTSMGERPSGGNGLTRFEMAQQALIKLLDRYQELGNVRVQLVTFSDSASIKTATWVDAAIAKQVINGLDYDGNTNYDDALEKAKAAFTQTGAIAGAKNVAYFLSDGEPNKPDYDHGIDPSERRGWESFLKINKITAYAVGIGEGATISALEPIAFNGADANKSVDAFVAEKESELASQLQETVAPSVIGNLLTVGSVSAGIGADGGRLSSVTVDRVVYSWGGGSATPSNLGSKASYNSTTHELTITTAAGGKLVIDLDDGSYRYQAASKAAMGYQETIGFSVVDRDGDSVNANVTLNVVPDGNAIKTGDQNDSVYLSSDRPSVAAHTAIEINGIHYSQPGTYQDGTAGVVIKKDSADTVYTYGGNDHVEGGRGNDVVYLGDSGSNLVDFSSAIDFVKADVATITLQPAAGVAREDGDLISAKASVAWGDVAQGAQGNDFLFGEDGVDLLFGGSGNDYLDGGQDRDFIRGGSGDDVILGGSGSDYLRGEEGADTFLWQQGDDLEQGAVGGNTPSHAIDYITDFHVDHLDTTTGYGDNGWYKINQFKDVDISKSDKLDLSDLLDYDGTKQEADLTKLLSVFESGTDVHIQVRASEGSPVVSQEIVLLNTTFESITGDSNQVYDSSTSNASEQVINYMLQNHLLDIDK